MSTEQTQSPKRRSRLLWIVIILILAVVAFDYLYPDASQSKRIPPPAARTPAVPPVAATEQSFDSQIAKGVHLVDFWAEWCGPCKMQAPIINGLSDRYAGKAQMLKVDVEKNPTLAARFGVQAIPTLILFKDGEAVQSFIGLQDETTLSQAIEHAL